MVKSDKGRRFKIPTPPPTLEAELATLESPEKIRTRMVQFLRESSGNAPNPHGELFYYARDHAMVIGVRL